MHFVSVFSIDSKDMSLELGFLSAWEFWTKYVIANMINVVLGSLRVGTVTVLYRHTFRIA